MIYQVNVEKLILCGCYHEGFLIINLHQNHLMVYYQTPDDWILDYLTSNGTIIHHNTILEYTVSTEIKVDLRVIYGDCIVINERKKSFPISTKTTSGDFYGEVIAILSDGSVLVDCGLVLEIENKSKSDLIKVGDFITTSGSYQVFFPDTDYSFE